MYVAMGVSAWYVSGGFQSPAKRGFTWIYLSCTKTDLKYYD